ncbi:MAG: Protein translocase subunit SecE [Phycisphaerales bacterium]|nr:Protein translocase subunit SecE [Phycisphaerales bacterium]MCK6476186.1 preprotein translocase subunit SecE [Phycisphaerales bacterium]
MLTGCLMGVMLLSAAVWAYQELSAVSIPIKEWNVTIVAAPTADQPAAAPLKAGDTIDLFAPGPTAEQTGPKVLSSQVVAVQATPGQNSSVVTLRDIQAADESATPARDQIAVAGPFQGMVTMAQGVRYFELLYLQSAVVGLILVTGAIFIYWLTGVRRNSVEFLIATDGEMKKVNWSTRKEVLGSTWVVIGACALIAAFLFVIDVSFGAFFKFIGLLTNS